MGLVIVSHQCVLFFSYVEYIVRCDMASASTFVPEVIFWYFVFWSVIPTCIVIVATIAILCHLLKVRRVSRRSGGTVRWQGMAAVSATATVFCVSAIPVTVSFFAVTDNFSGSDDGIHGKAVFVRSSHFISALNIMCNIYIYCLVIPSFRQFVKLKAFGLSLKILQILSKSTASHRTDSITGVLELRPIGHESMSAHNLR